MSFKNYRQQSRDINWGTSDERLTIEQINCGSMLRIADSMEKMSVNHIQLQDQYDSMKKDRDYYLEKYRKAEKQLAALKGHITRLKNKLDGTEQ